MTGNIKQAISRAVKELQLPETEVMLEHPGVEEHGDYSANIAMAVFARVKKETPPSLPLLRGGIKNPRELAEKIVEILRMDESLNNIIERIEVAGAGFINFYLKKEVLINEAWRIIEKESRYGASDLGEGKKVVIEYSSPNIAKPFGIGHLRSTVIGDAVANLLEFSGWQVYRDNHLGDWGTQFGKQIYAIKTWGDERTIENSEHPVKDLVDLYIKFHEEAEKDPQLEEEGRAWFKKLEEGDIEARRLWQKCIDWSWKEFDRIYEILDVKFTENNGRGYGESFFEDKMQVVIDDLENKGLVQESKGARLVFFPGEEYTPLMIIKNDGATLYATRDLAADKFRLDKYGKDVVIINEVGVEQELYFKQIFRTEEMLGWMKPGQRVHVKHGLFRLKEGRMSTRKGKVIWLEEVLQEAEQRAAKLAKDKSLANLVGVGALKWNDLKRSSNLDVIFDWDEVLRMDGNSGPYLQYTYARCKSVLGKHTSSSAELRVSSQEEINIEELRVLRWIYRFPEVVEQAAKEYAPNVVCTFLFELAQRYNAFYNQHSVLNADTEEQKNFRLLLTKATAQVLENGLKLLGIEAPERM